MGGNYPALTSPVVYRIVLRTVMDDINGKRYDLAHPALPGLSANAPKGDDGPSVMIPIGPRRGVAFYPTDEFRFDDEDGKTLRQVWTDFTSDFDALRRG